MKLDPSHVCIVQNGHYGDILDLLPVALHLHEQGKTVHWLCPEPERDIFEAVSYARPVDLPVKDVPFREMILMANERFEHVILGGIWDFKMQGYPVCKSYNVEHWKVAGYLEHFWNPEFRFVLDKWRWKHPGIKVPRIVANLTHGKSSPFPGGELLLKKLQAAFPGEVLDLGPLRLPKFLDLLDILALAHVLVSIDTGTLWLSQQFPGLPVVALVSHAPWGGSVLRRPVNARITYTEVTFEANALMVPLECILGTKANPAWRDVKPPQPKGNWPDCFLRGQLWEESPIKMRVDAIKAWREMLDGKELPPRFHEVMTEIARRLDVRTDDLIAWTGARRNAGSRQTPRTAQTP